MRADNSDSPRYVVIGAHGELWCSGCGSVIYDEEIHDDWHERLNGYWTQQELDRAKARADEMKETLGG